MYPVGIAVKKKTPSRTRTFVVFCTLVGILSLTSVILLIVAPAPLAPGATESLFAVDAPDSLDAIFDTNVPLSPGRWRYIYIHQSWTDGGNSGTLAVSASGLPDHFVIGNGNGAADGEIQIGQRWKQQVPAAPPARGFSIAHDCISICLIGDFDRSQPTATQLSRLLDLTNALRARLGIPADRIIFAANSPNAAGIGRLFPVARFARQIEANANTARD